MIDIDITKKSGAVGKLTTLFIKGRLDPYEKITPATALMKGDLQNLKPMLEDDQTKETFSFEIY